MTNVSTPPRAPSSNTVTFTVIDIIQDHLCIACDDAQKVYELIVPALKEGKKVIVDFQGIEETVPASMDSLVGQLYHHFPEKVIEESLGFVNFNSDIKDDIDSAVYWTKKYLEDPERFKRAAREFLGDDDDE